MAGRRFTEGGREERGREGQVKRQEGRRKDEGRREEDGRVGRVRRKERKREGQGRRELGRREEGCSETVVRKMQTSSFQSKQIC